ncbi:replication-relaxation family protein [Bacillus sp. CH30_1T]|uniref:replication-relaxation family protein n=1 Tax=Bacillus sp. CH30_1T TaxID=2604836 RepID=UPI0021CD977C|nr:replication-relaxation family protein [Bacillus sp. CH30_1T]
MKKLDYLSRSQIQRLHRLGSTRNANRVLKDMEEYLYSFQSGENVYYLNKEGRLMVNCEKICKKTPQVNHYIMRNWLFITLGCPITWKNEIKFTKLDEKISVVCDAMFMNKDRICIIEADYSQKMCENKKKIKKYKHLKDTGTFMIAPKIYWITTTEYRRKQLLALCEGLDTTIYLVSDFH